MTYDPGQRPDYSGQQPPQYQPGSYPVSQGPPTVMMPPAGPVKRGWSTKKLILAIVGGVVVLCCGGAIAIGATTSSTQGNDPKPVSHLASPSPTASPSPAATGAAPVATTAPASPTPAATTHAPAATHPPAAGKTGSKPKPAPTTRRPAPPPTTKKAAPPPPPAGPPTHSGAIKPGAFCKAAEEGWIGYSSAGKRYRCEDVDNNGHPHWVGPV